MPVPTLNGQWEVNGLLIGAGTLFPVARVEGLGAPAVRAAEIQFVDKDGGWASRERFEPREIVLAVGVDGDPDTSTYADLIDDLASAWRPSDSDVLVRWRRFGRVRRVYARPRGLILPWNDEFHMGAALAACRLVCLDPTIYDDTETVVTGTGGLSAPNDGNYPVFPMISITGPTATVTLKSNTDSGKQVVLHNLPGDTQVDMRTLTVTFAGSARPQAVDPGSLWWNLHVGANSLELTGATGFSVSYRNGWVSG